MTTTIAGVVLDPHGRPLDRIHLRGLSATGYHGVLEEERAEGQVFRADVVLHLDTRPAAAGDDLADTVSYAEVAQEVIDVIEGSPAQLVETVAERIAAVVLVHAAVVAVDVTVHKPQAPIPVPFDDVEVAIRRDRVVTPVVAVPAPAETDAFGADGAWAPGAALERDVAREWDVAREPDVAQGPVAPGPQPVAPIPVGSMAPALIMGGGQAAQTPVVPAPLPAPAVRPPSIRLSRGQAADVGGDTRGQEPEQAAFAAEQAAPLGGSEGQAPGLRDRSTGEPRPAAVDEPTEAPEAARAPVGPSVATGLVREHDRMDEVPAGFVEVVLALGSNVGDPQQTLRDAITDLDRIPGLEITEVSPLARTAATGGPENQPDYLNAVLLARTRLSARGLLHACQSVEHAHGRVREERWGPRTLDVDLIAYGTLTDVAEDIELPHPRAHERAFVLEPWSQIDPEAVLPGLGGGPVATLAATAPDREGIRWLALDWLTESVSESVSATTGAVPVQEAPPGSGGVLDSGQVDTPAQAQIPVVAEASAAPVPHEASAAPVPHGPQAAYEPPIAPGASASAHDVFAEFFGPAATAAPPASTGPDAAVSEAPTEVAAHPAPHVSAAPDDLGAPADAPASVPDAARAGRPGEAQEGQVLVPIHVQSVTPSQAYVPEYGPPEDSPPAAEIASPDPDADPDPDPVMRTPDPVEHVPGFEERTVRFGERAPEDRERTLDLGERAPEYEERTLEYGEPEQPSFPSLFAPVQVPPAGPPSAMGLPVPRPVDPSPATPSTAQVPYFIPASGASASGTAPVAENRGPVPPGPAAPAGHTVPSGTSQFAPATPDAYPSADDIFPPQWAHDGRPAAHPVQEQASHAPFPFAPVDSSRVPRAPGGGSAPTPGRSAHGGPFAPVGTGAGSAPGPLADPESGPEQQGLITNVPPIFPTGQQH